ncbi:hypothetical protein H8356DRAFT_1424948, partial [Neocallimastix lanati (nom. inval.)]|uniref:Uncharacterized protein n=1 Tax=Neocallimastix californiae TaxID=1754190 RepID=A0A1Y2EQB0_9FUNG|eukprot:ORY73739.1 hypothetical protein LY90DRAFT_502927 [Neocallimastix californiae]
MVLFTVGCRQLILKKEDIPVFLAYFLKDDDDVDEAIDMINTGSKFIQEYGYTHACIIISDDHDKEFKNADLLEFDRKGYHIRKGVGKIKEFDWQELDNLTGSSTISKEDLYKKIEDDNQWKGNYDPNKNKWKSEYDPVNHNCHDFVRDVMIKMNANDKMLYKPGICFNGHSAQKKRKPIKNVLNQLQSEVGLGFGIPILLNQFLSPSQIKADYYESKRSADLYYIKAKVRRIYQDSSKENKKKWNNYYDKINLEINNQRPKSPIFDVEEETDEDDKSNDKIINDEYKNNEYENSGEVLNPEMFHNRPDIPFFYPEFERYMQCEYYCKGCNNAYPCENGCSICPNCKHPNSYYD